MRAIRVDRLLALDPGARTYGWSTEMTVKALRAGYRYIEIPVGHRRRTGVSKVSGTFSGTVKAGFRILWATARVPRGRQPAAAALARGRSRPRPRSPPTPPPPTPPPPPPTTPHPFPHPSAP